MLKKATDKKQKRILIAIIAITFLTFVPVLRCGFTDWDDDSLLTNNPDIKELSLKNVQKIFTSTNVQTYVPLTVFSFALEYQVYKDNPFGYHLNNLLLHLAVTVLVFLIGTELGLSVEAAGLAALLFGIHPMRVESVAWISERKDVLYAFFYLLAVLSYLKYLKNNRYATYLLTVLFGLLSILAKPMALSLPIILFVIDWMKKEKISVKMFVEKIPYFLYVVPIGFITYLINARIPNTRFPEALWVWIWSFVFYIRKFLWPLELKPLYGFSRPVSLANAVYAQSVLAFCLIFFLIYSLRKNRWFIFAWVYYFASIFFLLRFDYAKDLGIVADRFMYLPSLGFCFFFGYAMVKLYARYQKLKRGKVGVTIVLVLLFSFLSVKSYRQIALWKDKASLWEYLADTFPDKDLAYNNMGLAFVERGDYESALKYFNKSIEINPVRAKIFVNRGNLYARQKEYVRAITDYKIAERIDPEMKEIYINLGSVLATLEKYNLAIVNFTKVINLDNTYWPAYLKRANLLMLKKDYPLALRDFNRVLELNPHLVQGYVQRAMCYRVMKKFDLALKDFSSALELDPKNVPALASRGNLYGMRREYEKALKDINQAIALAPDRGILYNDRGVIYGMLGKIPLALKDYNESIRLSPKYAPTYFARSLLHRTMGNPQQALADAMKAKELGYGGIDSYIRELQ